MQAWARELASATPAVPSTGHVSLQLQLQRSMLNQTPTCTPTVSVNCACCQVMGIATGCVSALKMISTWLTLNNARCASIGITVVSMFLVSQAEGAQAEAEELGAGLDFLASMTDHHAT